MKQKHILLSLSKKERQERALEIYNSAPETVRTPAQQKALERSIKQMQISSAPKDNHMHTKRPRARIISGGLPSLGKR